MKLFRRVAHFISSQRTRCWHNERWLETRKNNRNYKQSQRNLACGKLRKDKFPAADVAHIAHAPSHWINLTRSFSSERRRVNFNSALIDLSLRTIFRKPVNKSDIRQDRLEITDWWPDQQAHAIQAGQSPNQFLIRRGTYTNGTKGQKAPDAG